ncbi:aromatase/cyclase [Streptomyces cocklensis]|uniref:Granaticin polyketide synthase bifunctional cyclase/dehydratase n=1 Tax=Actinacidiphila cocklensis TaxID=887465 RepID=A0A9W4DMZ8_9ACTN|nr:aromatase/cyclase [Actinacidiphila cocklensis]MDD1058701.1 aromatase/cyclase [Actinacidiphila cocklensis]WSX75095.1 aromatase/cyclase [Streptomyces sp. NBC_00899]CAG6390891.1 Granaticin polyketide synthase bifunctional cyclase/dehydratase [Actinacidiphila cocklensis]
MTTHSPRQVEHTITVAAPAEAVYELIADVRNWPRIFPPTIHVEYVQKGEHDEYIQIWATANGEAKNWTSRRILQPEQLRINFQQTVSVAPVASMGGAWLIEEQPGGALVRLLHEYRAVDDDPASMDWIDQAVDRNSRSELAALKQNVEAAHAAGELTFSFEDSVHIDGRAEDAFAFINEAGLWSERLPHVAKVRLDEDEQGLQTLEMDTVAKDGSTHTTKSYRVTFPVHSIAYKQVTLPALLTLHTGLWTFQEQPGGGVVARSQHTVVLNPETIAGVLGPQATVEDARAYVHSALSTNSLATLGHARTYAEKAR